jgi:PAS domain S-box-containing protein
MHVPMPKEINCLNFVGLFSYLERNYGRLGINAVINGLVDNQNYLIRDLADPTKLTPIGRDQIVDLNYWVSNEFSLALLHNVCKVVTAPNPLFEAGKGAVRENLSRSALFIGKLFGPVFLARQAAKINSRFNRTKQVIPHKVNNKELAFELRYLPNFRVTKDVCNWNLGIYAGLMDSSGVKEVQAEEVKCVLNGDECCEFRLQWKKSGKLNRMIRGLGIWQVKEEVQDVIEEYEGSLRERDRLIDDLVASEEKYKYLFENSATANAIIDADLTLSLVNSEFEKLTGYEKQVVENKWNLNSLLHPSDFMKVKSYFVGGINENDDLSTNIELDIRDKDGAMKTVLCKIGSIPNSLKRIASMMDVTEMKRAEKEKEKLKAKLARAEKMEALGFLAGGVAHDLNNVLSGIVSYPELLLLDLPEDSQLRKPILTIQESGLKAAAIVQDLLTLARRNVAATDVVNLNDIIDEYLTSAEFEKMMSFHPDVRVQFKREQHLLNILGSTSNLFKTIMNLITNAAEATIDGGTIHIATKNVYIERPVGGNDAFPEGDYVLLLVSDTGIGIPKKDLERIFEPFYSKKVMDRSGTGLGMTVVWGIVTDHQGHIDVVSQEGKGTTFKLHFPATRKAPKKMQQRTSIPDLMGNGESILVVDDVEEQRALASNMIKRLGYKVNTVSSGEAAVDFIKTNPNVDVLVLDMIMYPGIDGLECFRRIREVNPDQKAIIASGFSETDRVKGAQSMGAGVYIRKPYLLENIGLAIRDELRK